MCETAVWKSNMCEHDEKHIKPVESIKMCANGMQYCKQLMESGEMPQLACEPCIMEWLCDDPIETCMNPENDVQWWTQCTRPVTFWMIHIEHVLNDRKWVQYSDTHWYYTECIKSIGKYMDAHEISVKLVETSKK